MASEQRDHDPIIQEFLQWIKSNSIAGARGETEEPNASFVPVRHLDTWLEEDRHAEHLLRALWHDVEGPPVSFKNIQGKYSRAFAALLFIGKGRFIQHFVQYESLSDAKMPFPSQPDNFPESAGDDQFFERFAQCQWQFFPYEIRAEFTDQIVPEEQVLPFKEKTRIGEGGFADTYKIKLHDFYDELGFHQGPMHNCENLSCHAYVIKTYRGAQGKELYNREIQAFKRLRKIPHCVGNSVIGFYGSYIQGDEYNIVLEYADQGNLDEFWRHHDPPATSRDIYLFWDAFVQLLTAAQCIHNADPFEAGTLKGWHHDIKPDNILVSSTKKGYGFAFKIADLGLSHFRNLTAQAHGNFDRDAKGTKIYGAPERYRSDDAHRVLPLAVGQSVDIWSLGCIFSEAAVWVGLGRTALQKYADDRKDEQDQLHGFQDLRCFHNGQEMLQTVERTHERVRTNLRGGDYITADFINRMIEEMMWPAKHANDRPSAQQLGIRASQTLSKAAAAEGKQEKGSDSGIRPASSVEPWNTSHRSSRILPHVLPSDLASRGISPVRRTKTAVESIGSSSTSRRESHADPQAAPVKHSEPQINPPLLPTTALSQPVTATQKATIQESHTPQSPICQERKESTKADAQEGLNQNGVNSVPDRASHESAKHSTTGNSKAGDEHIESQETAGENGANGTNGTNVNHSKSPSYSRVKFQPPSTNFESLYTWILEKKNGKASPLPEVDNYLQPLGLRDHVFLVDEAASMKEYWSVKGGVVDLTYALAYMVKSYDKNGIELHTTTTDRHRVAKNASALQNELRLVQPFGTTDISHSLWKILGSYEKKLKLASRKRWSFKENTVKPLNLYVLTDGIWEEHSRAEPPIQSLIKTMKEQGYAPEQVGIQFIRFGDDPDSIRVLQQLDDMAYMDMDIVDTEPATGNVWKMLAGAVRKSLDKLGEVPDQARLQS